MVARCRADVRVIERNAAMQILGCIGDCYETRGGDVRALRRMTGFRLPLRKLSRVFDHTCPNAIEITKVKERKDAYK